MWILSWEFCGELLAVASPGVELGEEDEVCACGAGTTSGFGSLKKKIYLSLVSYYLVRDDLQIVDDEFLFWKKSQIHSFSFSVIEHLAFANTYISYR